MIRTSIRFALLAASALLGSAPTAAAPASIQSLVQSVTIPHTIYKLDNGLTVIIHEDHKAPIAAVSVWYNVGSKDEPRGKTGFAHLFEHLMFNGSENMPGDYFKYLQAIGATDTNGTTNTDRTNYFETVPAGALERALFMESDRMGHLLGAITQGVLDNQRSVVQNEKRQGDSRPGGLIQYELFGTLFPVGHPYHHTTIGSMADLDAASLADVKQWFRDKYGPNNAVLVVAGDVTPAQVKPLVEKYFGPIPRGPVNHPAMAGVPTLARPQQIAMKDTVATTIISRNWAAPGLLSPQLAPLDIGGSILGGLSSSRLDNALVRGEKIAVSVSASLYPLQRAGIFSMQAVVKPGVDPALVTRRMDEVMAKLLADGPTRDEVQRAVMREVAGRVRGLEQVGGFGGKAVALAEGQTFASDSDFYKTTLAEYAAVTPAAVRTAMRQWLKRPPLTVVLTPGQREQSYAEAKAAAPLKPKVEAAAATAKPARPLPLLGELKMLQWPQITHTALSNGVPVVYAQRSGVPVTQIALAFDAGVAADPPGKRGLATMAMSLLDEGTPRMSSQQLAEAQERLGAEISASNDSDRSIVGLSALSPNLAPSLDIVEDITRQPAFDPGDIDRIRAQLLTGIEQMRKDPQRVGQRLLPTVLYGAQHPYGGPSGGDPAVIEAITQSDLIGWQHAWLRPDNLKIFVVSDLPLADIQPELEKRFGLWAKPPTPKGVKRFPSPPARVSSPKILLIDRPGAPQATILGGELLPLAPSADVVPISMANEALGGDFLSRLNMDLRETKGWSYGVSGDISLRPHTVSYIVSAPVQADRTGDALAALQRQIGDFVGAKPMTAEELSGNVVNAVNQLPGEFETAGALLGGMMRNDLLNRPDDYYVKLPARYRAVTPGSANAAARALLDPKGFIWVVTGDAAKLKPQLEKLGIPIEVVEAP